MSTEASGTTGKKIKIRIISRKTGRKLDLNLKFKFEVRDDNGLLIGLSGDLDQKQNIYEKELTEGDHTGATPPVWLLDLINK